MGRDANIEVVARVRPSKKGSPNLTVSQEESFVEVYAPREDYQGEINNRKDKHTFGFSRVLDPGISQEDVFELVARPICDSALDGFNATIFAYGQTGSGKTFTITGGAERYVDRGVIPRSISYIFAQVAKRAAELVISVQISYLEIYNEKAYDLLDPSHDTKSLEDLPKVVMLEDENGVVHTRNLGVHPARSEEDALNLLFIGDTNRMIAETPMNMASSRSHCIFTMQIETRKAGSDTLRRSKLHFVDLAGSERVKKTGVEGTLLRDAMYINTSLLFLEQVIVALHERSSGKSRNHIPYRNSLMTMVLRDSLGGNCKTTMIATMAAEDVSLPETVSTCRFAQRVAQISNRLEVNEEVDPKLMIARLRAQVADLKAALAEARGDAAARPVSALSAEERARCEELVNAYMHDSSADALLEVGDMAQVQLCFALLKARALGADDSGGGSFSADRRASAASAAHADKLGAALAAGAGALELQLQQRDHEIAILVSMLKKKSAAQAHASEAWTQTAGVDGSVAASGGARASGAPTAQHAYAAVGGSGSGGFAAAAYGSPARPASNGGGGGCAYAAHAGAPFSPSQPRSSPAPGGVGAAFGCQSTVAGMGAQVEQQTSAEQMQAAAIRAAGLDPAALLHDRNAAFELFRKSYRKNQVIEENKAMLKDKYDEAKGLGAAVNSSRAKINKLKAHIEQIRVERAMHGLSAEPGAQEAPDPEEDKYKATIELEKEAYKANFNRLKELKTEIEHLQLLLEQSRKRLQKDFDGWFLLLERQGQQQTQPASAYPVPASPHACAYACAPPGGAPLGAQRTAPQPPRAVQGGGGPAQPPQLTGNAEVDAEILAFYRARESLLQSQQRAS
ncbi:hypothetical protein KFE25_008996 [Diacronema lutheri]|uniref:Kinesin-like protein n=1 Tax=Diacronema lutheri TaxID=2081491 RepID=A0A8J5Y338_DIALT|nr:hypothetical protein KFE25_008996 [Diacronema lutheri]